MLLLAHRGASADAPENTLDAFEEALRQGADGVELDVQLCADGQVVVFHDPTLARLSDVAWPVRHTPWRKLRTADVGSRAGFAPARIPLLSEVLSVLPPDVLVNVEVKCESLSDEGLTQRTVEVIRDYRAGERVVISSFNPLVLFRLAQLAPELRRGYLTRPDRPFLLHGRLLAPLVSTWSVHCHHAQVTWARAGALREGGLRLAAWTVDAPEEAARLRDVGVDYLITNRPAHLRAALAKRRSATAT